MKKDSILDMYVRGVITKIQTLRMLSFYNYICSSVKSWSDGNLTVSEAIKRILKEKNNGQS